MTVRTNARRKVPGVNERANSYFNESLNEPTIVQSSIIIIIIIINPLTARVVGAPQMILQPVFSIFPCSPLPSGTCRTPGLSNRPYWYEHHLVVSSSSHLPVDFFFFFLGGGEFSSSFPVQEDKLKQFRQSLLCRPKLCTLLRDICQQAFQPVFWGRYSERGCEQTNGFFRKEFGSTGIFWTWMNT